MNQFNTNIGLETTRLISRFVSQVSITGVVLSLYLHSARFNNSYCVNCFI